MPTISSFVAFAMCNITRFHSSTNLIQALYPCLEDLSMFTVPPTSSSAYSPVLHASKTHSTLLLTNVLHLQWYPPSLSPCAAFILYSIHLRFPFPLRWNQLSRSPLSHFAFLSSLDTWAPLYLPKFLLGGVSHFYTYGPPYILPFRF
jgi:hypothetical protein